ncbi:MAG: choice-of-anchor tandem repeat GloVer-containing protein [Candidatus Cybelea sp.]
MPGTKHPWTGKVLHACGAPGDGNSPYGAVIADKRGNLYGTTVFGRASNAGIVYKLSPSKKITR